MSWVSPRTWTAGELVTADEMNEQLRDNTTALGRIGTLRHELRAPTAVETLVDGAWLELNEADVSRTTYATLWTLLGTTLARTYSGATTLSAAIISTTATSVSLTAWPTGWPTGGRKFLILVDTEKMLVTAGFGTATLTVTRGVESTTAATHLISAAVSAPSQSPFGHGDGSTKFTLPGTGGRVLVAAASGGHTDVAALGSSDGVTVGNRRPKHRHTPHTHTYQGPSGGLANEFGNNVTGGSNATGSSDGGSGVSTDPLDAPAYLVAGVWLVKAL